MSGQTNAVFGVILLAQVLCTCTLPVPDSRSTTEPCVLSESCIDNLQQSEGGTEDDESTGAALQRQKRRRERLLNRYVIDYMLRTPGLKESNCTETFLGQTVSPLLCASDRVVFTPLKGMVSRHVFWVT